MPKVVFHISVRNPSEVIPLDDFGISQKLWDSWSEVSKFQMLQNVANQYVVDTFGEKTFMSGKLKVTPEVVKEDVKFVKKVTLTYPAEEYTLDDLVEMSPSEWAALTKEQKESLKESWGLDEVLDFSKAEMIVTFEEV
jgi:hypothetical protein